MNIHPVLQQDCLLIGRFPLCYLLLMQDASYPWFILVPDREGITEAHHLCEEDQQQLMCESAMLARALETAFAPDKLNIAALGNVVPQLHLHHIVRYRHDPAWPAPVWGRLPKQSYTSENLQSVLTAVSQALGTDIEWLLASA